ncbi:MAG: hypothetical protein V1846_02670 [Candidatus Komeilibacteria bacterium]
MVNQQLLDYIKQCQQQGIASDEIRKNLVTSGWPVTDIDAALQPLDRPVEAIVESAAVMPPVAVTAPVESALDSEPVKKSRSKVVLLVVIILLGLIALGAGAAGYWYFFPSPERVLQKMSQQLATITSSEYQGEIKAEIPSSDLSPALGLGGMSATSTSAVPKIGTFLVTFSGKGNVNDLNNPNGQFIFNTKTDALPSAGPAETNFGLEARTIGKIAYLRFISLPNFGSFDLSFLANQWVKLDYEALQNQFGSAVKDQLAQQKLTPEQIQQIKQAVSEANLLTVTATLPGEKIEAQDTYHYKVVLNKAAVKQLLIDLKKIVENKDFTAEELQNIDKTMEAFDVTEGEIWIGKKDYLPYKLTFQSTIKNADKPEMVVKITTSLQFKNYNQPVVIEAPAESKTFEELMVYLLTSGTGNLSFSTSTSLEVATSTEAALEAQIVQVQRYMNSLVATTVLCLDDKVNLNCGSGVRMGKCTATNSVPAAGQPICTGAASTAYGKWPTLPGNWQLRYAISENIKNTFRFYASDGTTVAAPGVSASDGYACDQAGCRQEIWTNAANQGGK